METPVLKEPYTPYKAYLETLLSNLLMIAAFTAVAMLAFAFLFMFLLESRANEMRVMILCGASRLRVCLAVLSDAFVVNLLTGSVAVLAFVLMKDEIFSTGCKYDLACIGLSDRSAVLPGRQPFGLLPDAV